MNSQLGGHMSVIQCEKQTVLFAFYLEIALAAKMWLNFLIIFNIYVQPIRILFLLKLCNTLLPP